MTILPIWRGHSKRPYRLNKKGYAKSLMLTDWQRLEYRIIGLLWLMLMITVGYVLWQGWVIISDTSASSYHAAPNSIAQAMPWSPVRSQGVDPSSRVEEKSALQMPSVFHLSGTQHTEPSAPPTEHTNASSSSSRSLNSQSMLPVSRWVIQVRHGPILDASSATRLERARMSLQQAQFDRAEPIYMRMLQQDPHQLQALVGMLYISQMLADTAQYEAYLQRIQQLIPGIEANTVLFSQLLEDE